MSEFVRMPKEWHDETELLYLKANGSRAQYIKHAFLQGHTSLKQIAADLKSTPGILELCLSDIDLPLWCTGKPEWKIGVVKR